MSNRIHDNEPDTGEGVVRALLGAECPDWADSEVEYLATSGTDNAMWRIRLEGQPDVAIRLPRRPGAAAGAAQEVEVLRYLQSSLSNQFATPLVRHVGNASEHFPYSWSVLEWIGGKDAWASRLELQRQPNRRFALDLANAVEAIGGLTGASVKPRSHGDRGGALGPLLDRLEGWLGDPAWGAAALIDVAEVKRRVDQARELTDEPVAAGFVHGDLIPGNVLVRTGRLQAIIDWGGAGWGDRSQDLSPAWSILDHEGRQDFREAVGANDAEWIRGRTFELEHAVGGVLYYVPRGHQLGDVMARTLSRILSE